MNRATKGGYRGLIRTGKPNNEVMRSSMQGAKPTRVDKKQMYAMRYDMQFLGLSVNQVAKKYNLDVNYVYNKVYNYATMSLVIPIRAIKPEDYEG